MEKKTSIRISKTNHSELVKIQGLLQSKQGTTVSMDDTVAWVIDIFKKKYK